MKNVAYLSSLMNSRISCSSLSSIIRSLVSHRGKASEGQIREVSKTLNSGASILLTCHYTHMHARAHTHKKKCSQNSGHQDLLFFRYLKNKS